MPGTLPVRTEGHAAAATPPWPTPPIALRPLGRPLKRWRYAGVYGRRAHGLRGVGAHRRGAAVVLGRLGPRRAPPGRDDAVRAGRRRPRRRRAPRARAAHARRPRARAGRAARRDAEPPRRRVDLDAQAAGARAGARSSPAGGRATSTRAGSSTTPRATTRASRRGPGAPASARRPTARRSGGTSSPASTTRRRPASARCGSATTCASPGPVTFAEDLSAVRGDDGGVLRFTAEAAARAPRRPRALPQRLPPAVRRVRGHAARRRAPRPRRRRHGAPRRPLVSALHADRGRAGVLRGSRRSATTGRGPATRRRSSTRSWPAGRATSLDVGCGTGIAARALQARGCRVLGVEPDARMAAVARGHGVAVEEAAFERWDDAGRRFDLVACGQAWHWVDPVRGAQRAADVLRAGGLVGLFWNLGRPAGEAGRGARGDLRAPGARPRAPRRPARPPRRPPRGHRRGAARHRPASTSAAHRALALGAHLRDRGVARPARHPQRPRGAARPSACAPSPPTWTASAAPDDALRRRTGHCDARRARTDVA